MKINRHKCKQTFNYYNLEATHKMSYWLFYQMHLIYGAIKGLFSETGLMIKSHISWNILYVTVGLNLLRKEQPNEKTNYKLSFDSSHKADNLKHFTIIRSYELEQLEHLCSEKKPAATWLPIISIHIRSLVFREILTYLHIQKRAEYNALNHYEKQLAHIPIL